MKQSADKRRLDVLLVERGLADSRTYAQRLIRAGTVLVGTQRIDKPGVLVAADAPLRCTAAERKYAGRGGYKLAAALDGFGIDVAGWEVVDLGASTGGFVDCLLQRGAARVFAVDVGRAQLDARLARDARVVVLDQTNARYLRPEAVGAPVPLVTMDLSFISIVKVLPAAVSLLQDDGRIVALVKPQFEAGRRQVPRGGVVKDPAVQREVLERLAGEVGECGLVLAGVLPSPIAGAKGNREFLGHFVRQGAGVRRLEPAAIEAAVESAQASVPQSAAGSEGETR